MGLELVLRGLEKYAFYERCGAILTIFFHKYKRFFGLIFWRGNNKRAANFSHPIGG
jgi:hypothetical protein